MGLAKNGDILVIDNNGRMDEGCIGDLTALEAQACKLAGIIVLGCHRDTMDLKIIKFPIFSIVSCSSCSKEISENEVYTYEGKQMCDDCAMKASIFPLGHTGLRRDKISEKGRCLTVPIPGEG